ncbi:MAG: hypothetical protein LBB30_04295 [Candidatus Methanoplasma sp.]|jgi:hypothetical protein|nr:hypothetical protein [Candidatus Methanoplasma sp.]
MKFKKGILILLIAVTVMAAVPVAVASGAGEGDDIIYKKSFGGSDSDHFFSVAAVPGGTVAAGYSYSGAPGSGQSGTDVSLDAIIVKFDDKGSVVWNKRFGGSGGDYFRSAVAVPGGYVAVGYSETFGDGDLKDIRGKGGTDTIIVKFDENGNVEWKSNFGGAGTDNFYSVTAAPGGFVAAGYSNEFSFDNEDWTGVRGKGDLDAIIVRFDSNGGTVWKKSLGGSGIDRYYSVTTVQDGFVAVGYSNSLGSGDWAGFNKKGGFDAIIVKYDVNGEMMWKKDLGGAGWDGYLSVTAVSDGIIAAGFSWEESFGSGDWAGFKRKGTTDATIVKYDNNGNVMWKKNFGGEGADEFRSVTTASDGFVAVGSSNMFGSGDWAGFSGRGGTDAIIVKYNSDGEVAWKRNFGGPGDDIYESAAVSSGGVVAAGGSSNTSDSDDWAGIPSKGKDDAVIVKHSLTVLPFYIDVVGVPDETFAGTDLALTGTVMSSEELDKAIVWSVKDAGTTGSALNGNTLSTEEEGRVVVTATVKDGIGPGNDFMKDFTITVLSPEQGGGLGTLLWIGIVAAIFVICVAAAAVLITGRNR